MSEGLVAAYSALESLVDEIALASSDACIELEVAELAIVHERIVRKLGSVGLQRILDVSDREAFRAVQCAKLDEFVAQRLRIPNARKRLRQVAQLTSMHAMTGEKLPPKCPETADAFAEGALAHEHVDAVLDVMAKIRPRHRRRCGICPTSATGHATAVSLSVRRTPSACRN